MEIGLGQTNELNRHAYTTFPLSATMSHLGMLHLDLVGTMDNQNIERKRVIYAKAIQAACLHLEQLYLPKSYLNPHVIKNNNSIQSRNRGTPYKKGTGQRRCMLSKEERMLY